MDVVRSWTFGLLASVATFLIVLGIPVFRAIPLLQLLVPFAGGLVAAAVHPAPHRDRLGRHAVAVVPPGIALAVFGAYAAARADDGLGAGMFAQTLVLALLMAVFAASLMAWARRRVTAEDRRR